MKKFSLLLLALFFVAPFVYAQEEEEGSTMEQPVRPPVETPWEQFDIGSFSEPVPYVQQLQSDVMYYVTIWRTIDLREKRNHPLYFPIETRGTWRSLAQTIFDAMDYNNIENENALPVYEDEFCNMPKPRESVRDALVEIQTQTLYDPETYEEIGTEDIPIEYSASQVMYYNIKEVWFFDKKRSVMEVRILEIEPMIEYVKTVNTAYTEEDTGDSEDQPRTKKRVGYILYDELRPYLAKQEMFNVKNNAQRLSLDDVLTWKRNFASFIYAEQNTYSDRQIQEYIKNSRDQRIESERITERIRTFEHDLWEF